MENQDLTSMIPNDPRLTFDLINVIGVSSLCICMSYIDKLYNIEEIMHYK